MKVLIALSHTVWSEMIWLILADRGLCVETASDGLDCLAKLRTFAPDVLLLDLYLPWGGGDGVLARLREESDGAAVPVVLLAPAAADGDLPELVASPVTCCLRRPLRLSALLGAISSATVGKRAPRQRAGADLTGKR
jgi:CheY-like chemotaxis protein